VRHHPAVTASYRLLIFVPRSRGAKRISSTRSVSLARGRAPPPREEAEGERGCHTPDQHGDGATPRAGCTLVAYGVAKRLPIEFLREIGLSEISYQRAPAVRIREAVR